MLWRVGVSAFGGDGDASGGHKDAGLMAITSAMLAKKMKPAVGDECSCAVHGSIPA